MCNRGAKRGELGKLVCAIFPQSVLLLGQKGVFAICSFDRYELPDSKKTVRITEDDVIDTDAHHKA